MIRLVGAHDVRGTLPLRAGYAYHPDPTAGETAPYPQRRTFAQIIWLVGHHTGVGNGRPSLAETVAWQISPPAQAPFPGFAYTGYIDADGTIWLVWNIETVTWSQGDNSPSSLGGVGIFNYQGIAFCFAGEHPTAAQIAAFQRLKAALRTVLGHDLVVRSHRDVCGRSDTDCAGDEFEAALPAIQAA